MLVEPPSDSQLAYIASLCVSHEVPFPEAVASKQEASEIITALRTWKYDPDNYRVPFAWDKGRQ